MPPDSGALRHVALLEGMIASLTKTCGGHVDDRKVVKVTAASIYEDDPKYAVKNIADGNPQSRFWSKSAPGQWVQWDLVKGAFD
jgi:hypothetical protein